MIDERTEKLRAIGVRLRLQQFERALHRFQSPNELGRIVVIISMRRQQRSRFLNGLTARSVKFDHGFDRGDRTDRVSCIEKGVRELAQQLCPRRRSGVGGERVAKQPARILVGLNAQRCLGGQFGIDCNLWQIARFPRVPGKLFGIP